MMVSSAVTIQVIMSRPGDCTCREMSAETMKIPEPIIEPMTSVVPSMRPRPLTSCDSDLVAVAIRKPDPFFRTSAERARIAFLWIEVADDCERIGARFEYR